MLVICRGLFKVISFRHYVGGLIHGFKAGQLYDFWCILFVSCHLPMDPDKAKHCVMDAKYLKKKGPVRQRRGSSWWLLLLLDNNWSEKGEPALGQSLDCFSHRNFESAEEEGCKTDDGLNGDDLQLESQFCSLFGNWLDFANAWGKKMWEMFGFFWTDFLHLKKKYCSLNFLNEL